jgi:quercetin dioxygenase-like cupin family protein
MSRKRTALFAAAVSGAILILGGVLPSTAQEVPLPIAAEPLSGRASFIDDVDIKIESEVGDDEHDGDDHDEDGHTTIVKVDDPTHTVVVRFTIQPGAVFPWHTHPGPVIVNVTQGSLVYVPAEDCSHRTYAAGTAFVDPGHGHVHSATNPGTEETILVATFFEAPPGAEPLLIPAEAPEDCVV